MSMKLRTLPLRAVYNTSGAFAFVDQKKVFVHLIKDKPDDKDNIILTKMPGGGAQANDMDEDIWYLNLTEHLRLAGFSNEEISTIIEYTKEYLIPTMIERTLIREIVSEQGFFPKGFALVYEIEDTVNHGENMGKPFFKFFFQLTDIVVPESRKEHHTAIQKSDKLWSVQKVGTEDPFKSSDTGVVNPFFVVTDKLAMNSLINGQKKALKAVFEENFGNFEFYSAFDMQALELVRN